MKQYVIREDKSGYFVRKRETSAALVSGEVNAWGAPTLFDLVTAQQFIQKYRQFNWTAYGRTMDIIFPNGNLGRLALRPVKVPNKFIINFNDLD